MDVVIWSICLCLIFDDLFPQPVTHYLVKWCSLPYEESTWELVEDIDPVKIQEYEELQIVPEISHVVKEFDLFYVHISLLANK